MVLRTVLVLLVGGRGASGSGGGGSSIGAGFCGPHSPERGFVPTEAKLDPGLP
jgi:hypothetical protein